MKYTGNTVSKPVVGKSAEKLAKALQAGSYVSNDAAKNTIREILEYRKKQSKVHATTKGKI